MSSLDVLIVLVMLAYAVSGYVQGFVVNLIATAGLLIGGLIGIAIVPRVLSSDDPTLTTSLLALGIVIASAAIGQALGTYVGSDLRGALRAAPLRRLDAVGGAALSMVVVLVASWALGYSVSGTSIPYLAKESRSSAILGKVDSVMPGQASQALRAFNKVLDANLFPRYIDPFADEKIVAVGPPSDDIIKDPEVRTAADSVVKVLGVARCDRGIEGSGFVYAQGRVMTNAHVVAGVSEPTVTVDGKRLKARVVLFDPELDIAVLSVDGLGLAPLSFDTSGAAGDDAAILGFPENGPFDARAARIRDRITLRSPDIYDRGQVLRQTFAVRGLVRSGNSGGPLVSPDGDVLGVIFAASVADGSTGYAVTAEQVQKDAERGRTASSAVDTGGCA